MSAKTGINYPDLEPGNKFLQPGPGTRFLLQITNQY